VLHRAGFTPRVLSPFEERALLDLGCGITNLIARATASAAELTSDELVRGARRLERQIRRLQPGVVAFLGLSAYRIVRNRPAAAVGACPERIGRARVWLLPNPSGLNAHYQIPELTRLYAALRRAAFGDPPPVP
jgi:TDG/mug DNA glycosylase family protein